MFIVRHANLNSSFQPSKANALLGDVEVVPSSGHAAYIERLAQADVILQSFPFGGANTTIDGFELGIPVVCLRGDSLSGRIDPMLLAHYGAGQWCADDLHAYAKTAMGILRDPDATRRRLAGQEPVAMRAATALAPIRRRARCCMPTGARAGAAGERP